MVNYQEARVKLTNAQLNKLIAAAKKKTRPILRINKKNFQHEEVLNELLSTTRQTIKIPPGKETSWRHRSDVS